MMLNLHVLSPSLSRTCPYMYMRMLRVRVHVNSARTLHSPCIAQTLHSVKRRGWVRPDSRSITPDGDFGRSYACACGDRAQGRKARATAGAVRVQRSAGRSVETVHPFALTLAPSEGDVSCKVRSPYQGKVKVGGSRAVELRVASVGLAATPLPPT